MPLKLIQDAQKTPGYLSISSLANKRWKNCHWNEKKSWKKKIFRFFSKILNFGKNNFSFWNATTLDGLYKFR